MSAGSLRAAPQNLFYHVRGRIAGLQRQGHDTAARSFHFFPAGDEMRPVRAFDQNVGQHFGDQFARGIFVKEGDCIDRLQRRTQASARSSSGISGREAPSTSARWNRCSMRE